MYTVYTFFQPCPAPTVISIDRRLTPECRFPRCNGKMGPEVRKWIIALVVVKLTLLALYVLAVYSLARM